MITQYSRLSDHTCPDETATVVNGKWICNCPKRSEEQLPKITGKERSTAMRISTAVEDFVRQHYGKQITYESWDGQKAEQTITLDHYGVVVEIIVRAVPKE